MSATNEQKHTPTPWVLDEQQDIVGASGEPVIKNDYEGFEISAGDSALIVRAVNSHEQLVVVAKAAMARLTAYQGADISSEAWIDLQEEIRQAGAALAAAGAA